MGNKQHQKKTQRFDFDLCFRYTDMLQSRGLAWHCRAAWCHVHLSISFLSPSVFFSRHFQRLPTWALPCSQLGERQGVQVEDLTGQSAAHKLCKVHCLPNIAMEHGPFIDGLPIKHGDFPCMSKCRMGPPFGLPSDFCEDTQSLNLQQLQT